MTFDLTEGSFVVPFKYHPVLVHIPNKGTTEESTKENMTIYYSLISNFNIFF